MTSKVKTFFHIFSHSLIPKASYYQKILKARVSYSVKYFFILIVFLNLFFSFFLFLKFSPLQINEILTNLIGNLEKFPSELIININNGTLTSNYNRPYFFWLDYKNAKHLLFVIDETASPQKIKEYNSFAVLSRNNIVFKDENSNVGYNLINLKFLKNQIITKETIVKVQNTLSAINHGLFFIYPLAFVLVLLMLLAVSSVSTLLYILIASGITFIFYRFFLNKKIKPGFMKTLQISLHSVTLPFVINYIYGIFYLNSYPLPLLFLFLVVLFTIVGVYEGYAYDSANLNRLKNKK
ncbi:DUF1189 family protein [Candidatus Roizmanbacteria bacterium]|nr:DUF1189 family protein [Candidatus Roizmanbacteria bacterium]